MAWTTDDFVAAVRLETFSPDAGDVTAANILSFADSELLTGITTSLKSAREGYWEKYEDTAIAAGVRRYRLPRRASVRSIRSCKLVDAAGIESDLAPVDSGEVGEVSGARLYYLEDDFLVFTADPTVGNTLRVRYLRRPSRLVPVASCEPIVSRPSSITLLTVATAALFPTKTIVDIVRGDSPFDLSYTDLSVSGWTSPTYTLNASANLLAADFVSLSTYTNDRQDYLCARDTTCYPPLPIELHPVLVAAVSRRMLEAIGDRAGAEIAQATLAERMKGLTSVVQPRVQNGSRLLVNRSTSLRASLGGNMRRR